MTHNTASEVENQAKSITSQGTKESIVSDILQSNYVDPWQLECQFPRLLLDRWQLSLELTDCLSGLLIPLLLDVDWQNRIELLLF